MSEQNVGWMLRRFYVFKLLLSMQFFSAVLVPFFTVWGKISLAEVQTLQSWFMLCIVLSEIPTGAFADRFGRKRSLLLGTVFMICGFIVYPLVPDFRVFMCGELMLALGQGFISGADTALLKGALKHVGRLDLFDVGIRRSRSFSMVGIMLSGIVGGVISTYFGMQWTMFLSAIPALLGLVVLWPFQDVFAPKANYLDAIRNGLRHFKYNRTIQRATLNMLLVSAGAYYVIWYYQPLLMRINVSIAYFGFMHAGLSMIQIVILMGFGVFVALCGTRLKASMVASVLTGLGFVAAIIPHPIGIAVFIILSGGFGLTRSDTLAADLTNHIPMDQQATVGSLISMLRRLALVILNPVMGLIATASLDMALLIAGLLPLLSLLVPLNDEFFERRTDE